MDVDLEESADQATWSPYEVGKVSRISSPCPMCGRLTLFEVFYCLKRRARVWRLMCPAKDFCVVEVHVPDGLRRGREKVG